MNPFLPSRIKPGFNRFSAARDELDQSSDDKSESPMFERNGENYENSRSPTTPENNPSGVNTPSRTNSISANIDYEPVTPKQQDSAKRIENSKNEPFVKKYEEIKLNENEEDFRGKTKSPFIKTAMVGLETTENIETFGINNWIELQELLKANLSFAKNEMEEKENLIKTLKEQVQKYSQLQLIIREKNELITQKKVSEEGARKVLLENSSEVLGIAEPYVKEFLYLIYNNPKIIAVLARNKENKENMKALEETLALSFYEDNLADEDGDYEVIRLFSELLEYELNNLQKSPEQIKQEGLNKIWSTNLEGYFNKLWTVYLKKTECKAYVRTILRNPLLAFIRERPKMKFDPKEVKKDLEKRKQRLLKNDGGKQKTPTKEGSNPKASTTEEGGSNKLLDGSPGLLSPQKEEDKDRIPAPKFKFKRGISRENSGLEESKNKELNKPFEMVDDYESPLSKIEDKEVVASIMRRFRALKRHLTTLIQSIFDGLDYMPMGLRILCKIIHSTAKNKFCDLDEKEYNKILFNYLFTKWIVPHYCVPGKTDVLEDFELSDDMFNSLTFIAKVLKEIFNSNTYQPDDIMSELNEYIVEIAPSIQSYFRELIAINEDSLNEIIQNKPRSSSNLKSRSICISLNEIKLLCRSVLKQKEELFESVNKLVNLAEMIIYYDQSEGVLSKDIDKGTGLPLLGAPQTFLSFTDVMFPQQSDIDYWEELRKTPNIPKDLPEEEKNLIKPKNNLINLLIAVRDIRSISKWTSGSDVSLELVLAKYSEKPFYIDVKSSLRNDKTSYISARFLLTLLNQLPEEYRANNYQKLFKEIADDFKKVVNNIHNIISSNKCQLWSAIDLMKAKLEYLKETVEERITTFKRMKIRHIIKNMKIPLCISSPSTIDRYVDQTKNNNKKSNAGWESEKKIEIKLKNDQGCIHQKFSMMKELSLSAGAIAIGHARNKTMVQSTTQPNANNNKAKLPEDDIPAHVGTIDKFIDYFGKLSEVKQTILLGKDLYGTNEALVSFYHLLAEEIEFYNKDIPEEDYKLVEDEVENYICKQLYYLTVPLQEQENDRKFWRICKTHDWVNYDHLEIIFRNRQSEMWEYAAKMLNQMDNEITPIEKLDCIMECFKTITLVLDLAAGKEGSGGADDTLPIMIYVVLKACPRRIQVNSNFIEYFRDKNKMQAERGYCFIQLQSAIMSILHIEPSFLRMDKKEYEEAVQRKDLELKLLGK